MEKLGVQFDDEKTKMAGTEVECPSCHASFVVDPNMNPPRCPHCASTAPFEKRPEK